MADTIFQNMPVAPPKHTKKELFKKFSDFSGFKIKNYYFLTKKFFLTFFDGQKNFPEHPSGIT
jgi:hypothetical protein